MEGQAPLQWAPHPSTVFTEGHLTKPHASSSAQPVRNSALELKESPLR